MSKLWIVLGLSAVVLSACSESGKGDPPSSNNAATQALAKAQARVIEVWKSPTCGCCKAWIEHLQSEGFEVVAHDVPNNTSAHRAALGMPLDYASCHSARVGGYAIEGHVPASDIRKLLDERPVAVGLAVPEMPIGSPGMEHPDNPTRRDAFDVLLVEKSGSARPYTHYPAK